MRIAFQGEPGAYSHEALLDGLDGRHDAVPTRSFAEAFQRTADGLTDAALVPIENALTGSIHDVYDLLLEHELPIGAEVIWPIRHALLAQPGTDRSRIERVHSHPQALWQCEAFLRELGAEQHAFYDTAGAAQWVADHGDAHDAAIAGSLAAELYGLEAIAEAIATVAHNATRFVLIGPTPEAIPDGRPHKTSLVVELAHRPGALVGTLAPLAERGINLTKLESRPLREAPWEYRFYLDLEGRQDTSAVQQALAEVGETAERVRVLGSYPSMTTEPEGATFHG